MFIDFKFSPMKAQVRASNLVFRFSVAEIHFVKPGLTKHVMFYWCECGNKVQFD